MLVRRTPHAVCYWQKDRFVVHNYFTGARVAASAAAVDILDFCGRHRTHDAICRRFTNYTPQSVRRVVADLVGQSLLERTDRRPTSAHRAMSEWDGWNPAAGFFHFTTKDVNYPADLETAARSFRERGPSTPMPSSVKEYRGAQRVAIPAVHSTGEFPGVLLQRRTWRRFSPLGVHVSDLATALQLTWGVQHRATVAGQGDVVLKTSPSGGARHPGEVYVLALKVRGLDRGLYHYASHRHELELLTKGSSARQVARYLPGQGWYRGAAALLLMTAVFPREQWRYQFARAYRAVLIEAGHLCQTFCLAATWLGLAPFCSMAFADSLIERDLGIDGVKESMLYVAGVGARPARTSRPWAPMR